MANIYPIPENYPQRFTLHNEVHARAPISLNLPFKAAFLAITLNQEEKKLERIHLEKLCERYGKIPPKNDSSHFTISMDSFELCWEQHTEFSSYTFYVLQSLDKPFSHLALDHVPVDWLSELPGNIIVAIHASALHGDHPSVSDSDNISEFFVGNSVIGAEVSGGAARAFTDFKIHADGFSRFLILDHHLKPGQAGRLLQRLFEIEVYRVMAMMTLPIAKKLNTELNTADVRLLTITNAMAKPGSDDARLLDELTTLAAEVENHLSTHHFRFGAASAYYSLVEQRIVDLREVRIQGFQTIGEFMKRRLEPAIDTCNTTFSRFTFLSKRINNASQLLRTRVDISIEQQNQALLTSMDVRAQTQLRLQETVESLSIVAITSYIVSLIGSINDALIQMQMSTFETKVVAGVSIPVVFLLVAFIVRRLHKRIVGSTQAEATD